jgi:hypothetical protein
VCEANAAAGETLRVPSSFLVGKPLLHFVARQDTRAFRVRVVEAETTEAARFEVRMRPRGHAPFLASIAVRHVRGEDGRTLRLMWTIQSVA